MSEFLPTLIPFTVLVGVIAYFYYRSSKNCKQTNLFLSEVQKQNELMQQKLDIAMKKLELMRRQTEALEAIAKAK